MKKLFLILSLISISNINADVTHTMFRSTDCCSDDCDIRSNCNDCQSCDGDCSNDCDPEYCAECDEEQVKTAQNIIKGVFSEQFARAVMTLAKKSQMPIKDFIRSVLGTMQLNKEQLQMVKEDLQDLCDITTNLLVVGPQWENEKRQKKQQRMNKHFAKEVAQNRCHFVGDFMIVNENVGSEQEKDALQEKINTVDCSFESEFSSPMQDQMNQWRDQLSQIACKYFALLPALQEALLKTAKENEQQLRAATMMVAASALKGARDTISQAVDERIKEMNVIK